MSYENKNPNSELCDLQVVYQKDEETRQLIPRVQLTLGTTDVTFNTEETYLIALRKLYISIDSSGYQYDSTRKFGLKVKPTKVARATTITSSDKDSGNKKCSKSLSLNLNKNGASGSAEYERGANNQSEHVNEVTSNLREETAIHRVTALGGLKWEVTEPLDRSNVLSGTYLNGVKLAEFNEIKGSNHCSMVIIAHAKQRDISIELLNKSLLKFRKNSNNKNRIFDILMSKFLHNQINSEIKYSGQVQFSWSSFENEYD